MSAGLLGAGLRLRQQSLVKDDLRGRQMSLGAESDTSSLYFSVSSHFDEGEREVESGSGGREGGLEEADTPNNRRRRRGNYVPPPQLLMWLEKSESTEEDTTDQPWPFSEKVSISDVRVNLATVFVARVYAHRGLLKFYMQRPFSYVQHYIVVESSAGAKQAFLSKHTMSGRQITGGMLLFSGLRRAFYKGPSSSSCHYCQWKHS